MKLPEMETESILKGLNVASFYEDFGETFSKYGRRRRWLGRSNQQQIANYYQDEKAIEKVMQRLERYDAANAVIRFLQDRKSVV